MKKTLKSNGFTLMEMLIVIAIIVALSTIVMSTLWTFGWAKARDSIRISNITKVSSIISSLQGRFFTPPLSGSSASAIKYPAVCKGSASITWLKNCLVTLKVGSTDDINWYLTDPKEWIQVWWSGQMFRYKYWATSNGFKICAYLEDQGALESLNADSSGNITTNIIPSDTSAYMYCTYEGLQGKSIIVN